MAQTRTPLDDRLGAAGARVVALNGTTRFARVLALATARLRTWLAVRAMRRRGCRQVRRFAIYPDVDTPRVMYEIDTAAASYAARELLPDAAGPQRRVIRQSVAALAGCDPRAGAILVVGCW